MADIEKLDFYQVEVGFAFPQCSYIIDESTLSNYLSAVEDESGLFAESGIIPPMAVAARAMASLGEALNLPPGTLHVSQGLEFIDTVHVREELSSQATVSRKHSRGKLRLMEIDLKVYDKKGKVVLTGKTSFILPE